MLGLRRIVLVNSLALFGLALLGPAGRVFAQASQGQATPMVVTTDTPEYCHKLLNRISELVQLASAPVPLEAHDLTSEGRTMCDHGQIRSGILRLRSALMMLEGGNGPAYR